MNSEKALPIACRLSEYGSQHDSGHLRNSSPPKVTMPPSNSASSKVTVPSLNFARLKAPVVKCTPVESPQPGQREATGSSPELGPGRRVPPPGINAQARVHLSSQGSSEANAVLGCRCGVQRRTHSKNVEDVMKTPVRALLAFILALAL